MEYIFIYNFSTSLSTGEPKGNTDLLSTKRFTKRCRMFEKVSCMKYGIRDLLVLFCSWNFMLKLNKTYWMVEPGISTVEGLLG